MYEECHIFPLAVMKIGEATIYAGKWADMERDLDWDLRIRLNDRFALRGGHGSLIQVDDRAREMLDPAVTNILYPPTLSVEWQDFHAPGLDREWWAALVKSLANLGPVAVALYCEGGHGRTGTALAILAGLSEQKMNKGEDVVGWVRRNYCQEAVESWAQVDYIEAMLDTVIASKPTSVMKSYGGQAYGAWESTGKIDATTTTFNPGNAVQSGNAKKIMQHLAKKGKNHP